jgi:hypothetical protein
MSRTNRNANLRSARALHDRKGCGEGVIRHRVRQTYYSSSGGGHYSFASQYLFYDSDTQMPLSRIHSFTFKTLSPSLSGMSMSLVLQAFFENGDVGRESGHPEAVKSHIPPSLLSAQALSSRWFCTIYSKLATAVQRWKFIPFLRE